MTLKPSHLGRGKNFLEPARKPVDTFLPYGPSEKIRWGGLRRPKGCWRLCKVPLLGCCGSLSFGASVLVSFRPLQGDAARCLWQCAIWSVGAGVTLPTSRSFLLSGVYAGIIYFLIFDCDLCLQKFWTCDKHSLRLGKVPAYMMQDSCHSCR